MDKGEDPHTVNKHNFRRMQTLEHQSREGDNPLSIGPCLHWLVRDRRFPCAPSSNEFNSLKKAYIVGRSKHSI